ncbi:MAG: FKBP-type peptidyl-prolyl cis-trans isomerase [Rickettsia endosymbiont of Ixodes persulcatus]|nr:FKBP-type peptidyl-prolyl cis-trans isomerase [Rickettsia endosymbiont of Ixodes persulcatus]
MKFSAMVFMGASLVCANVYADQMQVAAAQDPAMVSAADKSKVTGDAFLAANKKKPGVVTTGDGLQYKVLNPGKGAHPTDTDTVVVNYEGKLVDGTEFDSSYKRGEPATFPVNGVIPGWTEALKLMRPGATWMLYIPASLAYGEQGAPPSIGPNETLVFKVNLIEIKKD